MTKGWKTSEFWLTALFNLGALLTVVAGVVPAQAAPIVVAAAGVVTALYNFGRSLVKAGASTGASIGTVKTSDASDGADGADSAGGGSGTLLKAARPNATPQRRATDVGRNVGREVAAALERAAVAGVLKNGVGASAAASRTQSDAQGDAQSEIQSDAFQGYPSEGYPSEGSEVFDERNAG